MDEPQTGRRWTDHVGNMGAEDIKALIMRSTSEDVRAMLLILQQLSESTIRSHNAWADLATAFKEHQGRFESHLQTFETHAEKEMQLINRGIGGWRAIAIIGPLVLSTIGALGLYNLNVHIQALGREMAVNEAQGRDIADLKSRVDALSVTVDRNTGIINSKLIGLNVERR